jgi:hydroxyacid-oxoacid transhydrogenase
MLVRTALKRAEIPRLLMSSVGNTCPCHKHTPSATTSLHPRWNSPSGLSREYAFEMASSNIRFGEGVTR